MRDPVGRAGAALPEFAQLVELVEAGNAGTDDDRIEIRCHIRPGLAHCRRYGVHAFLSWHRALAIRGIAISRLSGQHRTGRLRAAVTENRGPPR